MIKVSHLSINTTYGRSLVEDLSFTLNDGDKLAVIGEEGNGKSTLMKAIINKDLVKDYCEVSGDVNLNNSKIGYLEQKLDYRWSEYFVIDFFLKDTLTGDYNYDVYNDLVNIKKIFKKLNLNIDYLDQDTPIANLSGGEKVKLQLVKLIMSKPDVVFLDEPTNDLDVCTLELLEKYINSLDVPLMFVSHDETLLENTANMVLHIEQLIKKSKPKWTLKKCSYLDYVNSRKKEIEHTTQMAYNQRREKTKKEEILRKIKQDVENALEANKKNPSAGRIIAKKMANIKAQERKNENEDMIEIPDVEEAINLTIDPEITIPSQKKVLDFSSNELKVGDKILSHNIHLSVVGPEKIAIIGNNGAGKTTLLKNLMGQLKNISGLKVGYFSQNYAEVLDYNSTAVDQLTYLNSGKNYNPRTLLGSLKFTRDEMLQRVGSLSEGQKAKLTLMKLIVEKNNVLVLDEPTRNLSPLSTPIIREILKQYNGSIITVSHDRKFIREICDSVYELTQSGLKKINFVKEYNQY